jgi:hypothetical protein
MGSWVISSNPETYNVSGSLRANGEMDWITRNNFAVGDTVYVYEVAPPRGRGGIVCKTEVIKTGISLENKIDDHEYWDERTYPGDVTNRTRFSRLKFVSEPNDGIVSLEALRRYGFTSPQGLAHLLDNNPVALLYIQSQFGADAKKNQHNVFAHPIHEGIVHPDDQPILDKYVTYHAVAASSVCPKRDGIHVVTLDDGRKVIAKWQGQRALELHAEKNLIKQTTYKGNVRYYMYLSEADGSEIVSTPRLYGKIVTRLANITDDEVVEELTNEDSSLDEIAETLKILTTNQPPERVARIVSKLSETQK